eukprot:CAMPEP_0197709050 /NCGR_PEP_ID=MMETSP1338-20131121/128260_1 /TAXON_ID=43686 ORGANISM="Pelagodinium beii, Strain RCC1491" /NCGR_SAMPLE_ID=MMETSP1338 /ASSEMBLY_ACC=CAM_ASM_000754 /LENGTH=859 /DNA_ID=CAMNT_0043292983 /DNA_START=182 /DNA_END=2756 /DNA_ORIENTATION=+
MPVAGGQTVLSPSTASGGALFSSMPVASRTAGPQTLPPGALTSTPPGSQTQSMPSVPRYQTFLPEKAPQTIMPSSMPAQASSGPAPMQPIQTMPPMNQSMPMASSSRVPGPPLSTQFSSQPQLPPTAGSSPGSMPGSMGGAQSMPSGPAPVLGKQCMLIVSKLLDMPIEDGLFGGIKSYLIRILDHQKRELYCSDEIQGLSEAQLRGQETETFAIPTELGTLKAVTKSKLLYLQVEYAGAIMRGDIIGVCQIHRLDPRSSKPWPYALSNGQKNAECGIELCVVEGSGMNPDGSVAVNPMASLPLGSIGPPPPMGSMGPGPMGPSPFASMAPPFDPSMGPPPGPLASMGLGPGPMASMGPGPGPMASMGPGPMASMGPGPGPLVPISSARMVSQPPLLDAELEDVHHGVSAMLELEGIKDLPAPYDNGFKDVMITILTDDGKELRKVGFFQTQEQIGHQLVSVDCRQSRAFVQAPLHFGGDAREGSQYIKIAVSYGRQAGKGSKSELVGTTDPVKVSWKPVTKQYMEIRNPQSRAVLGGIYLSHRLVTEAEAASQRSNGKNNLQMAQRQPQIGAPIEPENRVSGRTGHFPPGSQEEAFEQAAINAEAQNRALLQRCKKADRHSTDTEPNVRVVNGWREWDSLDNLFKTMGPNPLAMSDELGPQVARGYQHRTSVAKEVSKQLPPALSPADQMLNVDMLRMYYNEDPSRVEALVRPVVCKDPDTIAAPRDMTWCPDPPIYAPLYNMTENDKETVRLAGYAPEQNAALLFADVNPNYNIREDIWGAIHDKEKARSHHFINPNRQHARVKDDCFIAVSQTVTFVSPVPQAAASDIDLFLNSGYSSEASLSQNILEVHMLATIT